MTATASKTQALTEWTKVSPRQAAETYTSSVTFMKQLTVIAVSTITYLKDAFPKDNYKEESFCGLNIHILKKDCNDDLAQFLSNAMVQAFEAFEKKYLHRLALCFYDGNCKLGNLVEHHMFEYSYKPDGKSMTLNSKGRDNATNSVTVTLDNVREKTMDLIRACIVYNSNKGHRMPDYCDLCVRLYYNEDAPDGYQAPGFIPCAETEDPLEHTFGALIKLGRVETPYHQLVLRSYIENTAASNEPNPPQTPPVLTPRPGDFHSSVTRERSSASEGGSRVRCVCNSDSNAAGALLVCMYCNMQQHATCYGVTAARAAGCGTRHCCVTCSDQDNSRAPTDAQLASIVAKKRQCLAIFRRSLELCAESVNVSTIDLCDKLELPQLGAVKLMKMLQHRGIIQHSSQAGLATSLKIDHNQLKIIRSRYFQSDEENIVDRLVTETFATQSRPLNPVEDVLSPLEKVSLKNASELARVINNSEVVLEAQNIEDPTLKQYREALVLVERDDNVEKPSDVVNEMEKLRKRPAKRKEEDKKCCTGFRTKRARVAKKKNV